MWQTQTNTLPHFHCGRCAAASSLPLHDAGWPSCEQQARIWPRPRTSWRQTGLGNNPLPLFLFIASSQWQA